MMYQAQVRNHTALSIRGLEGDVPATVLTGDTADISHICEYGWYDYVWYSTIPDENMENRQLGRYLGPSHDVGTALCARILTRKGKLVSRTSVFPLSIADENSEGVKSKKRIFENTLMAKLGSNYNPVEAPDTDEEDELTPLPDRYEPNETP